MTTLTPSLEDYLEELYRFSLCTDTVRVTDLSVKLGVSMPSVTKALHKLKNGQYISYERYGEITLTEKGNIIGDFLVKRNQLLKEFLILIKTNCDIEAEAEAMEHYLSQATIRSIQAIVTFLNNNPEWYKVLLEYIVSSSKTDV
ncbi:metal-dependent transcriptional regulator [Desulfosporosinus sp. BICA1-9]|uniref:metal-dependent transcriptional regulator n=1 Tax=Desulfosporosinus sp. BICA1-9 TaxID=1531958 RepID=UPI00054BD7EB|nr:iron dependent repressor, metal binding and dimerization domain protein [Desulfosporosinus sp. BICA1-9]KJS49757.1 MAG: DNA-binding protein [Peptococcaceae bacterium BRH_c23]KJS90188.1 MAG: DNA-binding protein [Desulfosporosinus sp. BICA1-9]HBW38780.1 DNA-binding protein [Desulfosporosinus sp.]